MLKAPFVLGIFTFLSWLFSHVGKQLHKKAKVNSKFMTSKTGQQIITMHIWPNKSRRQLGNETWSFNRTWLEKKILFSKIIQKEEAERLVQGLFLFF